MKELLFPCAECQITSLGLLVESDLVAHAGQIAQLASDKTEVIIEDICCDFHTVSKPQCQQMP